MTTFSHIAGAEPSTITFKAATILLPRNSSAMHQEIVSLGDPNTPSAIAECSSSVPSSTQVGLLTKEAGGFLSSLAGKVTVAQLSTVWQVQSNGDSTVVQGTNPWLTQVASFAAGLMSSGMPAGNSSGLTVRPVWSSTNADQPVAASQVGSWVTLPNYGAMQSTVAPSSGSSGLIVRQVVDLPLTFVSTNAFASTLAAINSTATTLRCKVFGYSITSTCQTPTKIGFYGGSSLKWTLILAAVSSAVSGANLAVSPPAYLFGCAAGSSMTLRTPSSVAGFKVSISYFMGA